MINNTIVHIVLAVLAIIWLFPIAWVILTSFRAEKGSYVSTFFPKAFTLDNYIKLFTDTSILNFPQMFMNTLFIAICSCILSAFYVLAVSYCLSRLKFKMRKPYMNMAMILGLFPGFMSMIAVYFILKAMGLTEGSLIKLALILCYSGGAGLGFQIAKGFFDTIPVAIDEAALLDGCTRWQIFSKIKLTNKNYQNRKIAIIENGSWAPTAARVMKGYVEKMKKITLCEKTVTIKSTMKDADVTAMEELADELLA